MKRPFKGELMQHLLSGLLSVTAILILSCPLRATTLDRGMTLSFAKVESQHDNCRGGCPVLTSSGELAVTRFNETNGVVKISATVNALKVSQNGAVQFPALKAVHLTLAASAWDTAIKNGSATELGLGVPVEVDGQIVLISSTGEATHGVVCDLYNEGQSQQYWNVDRAITCRLARPQFEWQNWWADLPVFTIGLSK